MSDVMSSTKRGWLAIAAMAVVGAGAQLIPATALADPDPDPRPSRHPLPVDGVAAQRHLPGPRRRDIPRSGGRVQDRRRERQQRTADTAARQARSRSTRFWPTPSRRVCECPSSGRTGSNLHCEILVDDQIVAQADQFIAPRLFRPKDDPAIRCDAMRRPGDRRRDHRSRRPGSNAAGAHRRATGAAGRPRPPPPPDGYGRQPVESAHSHARP